ncbi:hypothetical protein [Nocardia sp. NPDC050710]|uniref:hypothetical protein n=1 Tax=Nocardia sp. NPDC050710 TaxID=3157220 RepID=UPI0034049F15
MSENHTTVHGAATDSELRFLHHVADLLDTCAEKPTRPGELRRVRDLIQRGDRTEPNDSPAASSAR